MVIFKNNIFYDYVLLTIPRDIIFGMYIQMTARNDIRNTLLHFILIRLAQDGNTEIADYAERCLNLIGDDEGI